MGTCTPETFVVPDFPNCKCWSLTDEETWGSKHGQAGAVWFNDTSLDPASTETSIEASAYLRFSTKTGHLDGLKDIFGGDGIAFVIHTEPEGKIDAEVVDH